MIKLKKGLLSVSILLLLTPMTIFANPNETTNNLNLKEVRTPDNVKIEQYEITPVTTNEEITPVTTSEEVMPVTTSEKVTPTSEEVMPVTTNEITATDVTDATGVTPIGIFLDVILFSLLIILFIKKCKNNKIKKD